jgi:hypothetical protein
MTAWEKKIIDAFIGHYFASVKETEDGVLRVRTSVFFPDFDTAHTDEKESYLEAAESLERKGIVKLNWEKRGKGERLKTLSCENFEKLFEEAGKPFPKTEAEKIRDMLGAKLKALKESGPPVEMAPLNTEASSLMAERLEKIIDFLEFYSLRFGPREIGRGIDQRVMEDLVRLFEYTLEPAFFEKITTRAQSILLYRDSKHLENLLNLCGPLITRANKSGPSQDESLLTSGPVPFKSRQRSPDFSSLERSYPETQISGRIIISFKNSTEPMVNADGHIVGFVLESAEAIESIQPMETKKEKAVLTIENKETFYALGTPQKFGTSKTLSRYDCFLYTGGYPNRAVVALIKSLAASGFSFYHAGDLDPDGVLILQNIQDIVRDVADRPVTPLRMDAVTFDQYRAWARTLTKPMLRQIEKTREGTKAIPGIAGLLRRIEETGLGVEQEIVEYR